MIKNGKWPEKVDKEIPRNKLSVSLLGTYAIRGVWKKENIFIKDVHMIDLITGWFKIPEYKDKHDIIIAKLVETTWLTRYSWQTEINHDQG